jgi:hypothetical protein
VIRLSLRALFCATNDSQLASDEEVRASESARVRQENISDGALTRLKRLNIDKVPRACAAV